MTGKSVTLKDLADRAKGLRNAFECTEFLRCTVCNCALDEDEDDLVAKLCAHCERKRSVKLVQGSPFGMAVSVPVKSQNGDVVQHAHQLGQLHVAIDPDISANTSKENQLSPGSDENESITSTTGREQRQPLLGFAGRKDFPINLGKLLSTRLLVQAASGGGKSYALRRILEQTHGMVQQIVVDPEGELETLAEKYDYLVCSPESKEAPISPTSGAKVADLIYRSGRSVILSLGDFELDDMRHFIAGFVRQLLRMPPELWHYLLFAVDEIQLLAPQHDVAESKKPMVDLAGRCRKRGLCLVGATQRLALLHKSVAASLENKLIGLTTLDTDVKRAADQLGMTLASARELLRTMQPGEFMAYGPGLSYDLTRIQVGAVETRHSVLGQFDSGDGQAPSTTREDLAKQLQEIIPQKKANKAEKNADDDTATASEDPLVIYPRFEAIRPFLESQAGSCSLEERAEELGVSKNSIARWLRLYDKESGPASVDKGRLSPGLTLRLRHLAARTAQHTENGRRAA